MHYEIPAWELVFDFVSSMPVQPLCENFAFSLFTRADDEDRSGNITKNTAKAFYSASNMFDVLEQFGNLDSEVWLI